MQTQYQILADLKRIDEKIYRLQEESDRYPLEAKKLQDELARRKEEYNTVRLQFEDHEKKLRKLELELKEKEDKLHKAEDKMMEVRTNEEYQAAIRENQGQKDEKSKVEENALKLMAEVDEERRKLKEAEKSFKNYETVVKQNTDRLEAERQGVLRLLDEQMQKRGATSGTLNAEVASIYNRLAPRIRGTAIVVVENGMCLGCHMKIRPQLFNEILGFKAIHRCPSCGRILITAPKEAAPSDSDSEIVTK